MEFLLYVNFVAPSKSLSRANMLTTGAAVVTGVIIGGFWLVALLAGDDADYVFYWRWKITIYGTCPAIVLGAWSLWLVPSCNGLLYGFVSYLLLRRKNAN